MSKVMVHTLSGIRFSSDPGRDIPLLQSVMCERSSNHEHRLAHATGEMDTSRFRKIPQVVGPVLGA